MKKGILFCLMACFIAASVAPVHAEETRLTRLRAGQPKGTFRHRRYTRLTEVQVEVKNVGEVAAESVSVQVEVPGGSSVSLSGPSTLLPRSRATYSAKPSTIVTRKGKLKADVDCANCR